MLWATSAAATASPDFPIWRRIHLARCIWTDIGAVPDAVEPGESNTQFHYAAFCQFVVWQYRALGQGHRVVIPSCCVWTIRDCFNDPHGQYQDYVPLRLNRDNVDGVFKNYFLLILRGC